MTRFWLGVLVGALGVILILLLLETAPLWPLG